MFRSIKTKILAVQLGLVFSIAAILGVAAYLIMYRSLKDTQQQHLEYVAVHVGMDLSSIIEHKKVLLEKIGTSEQVENYRKKHQSHVLIEYFNKFASVFPVLSYVNEKGSEEIKVVRGRLTTELSNIKDSVVFEETVWNANKAFSFYSTFCSETKSPCLEFSFYNQNFFDEFIGVVLGKVPVDVLAEDIQKFEFGQSGFAVLLDAEGTILSCRDGSKVLMKLVVEGPNSEQVISGIKTMKSGFNRVTILGIDGYVAYAPVPGQSWSILAVQPYEEFMARLDMLKNTVILVGFIVLIAGTVLSLVLDINITRPILELVKRTNSIAKGNLSQRIDIKSKDEIGTLSNSFNRMVENLRSTTTSVVNLNREIAVRKKAERAMQKLNLELERVIKKLRVTNQELFDYAHVTAHDLKAPLRAIGSLAGIISTDYADKLDSKGLELLNTLIGRTQRMSSQISSILQYSEVGRTGEVREKRDLNAIVSKVISDMGIPENIEVTIENELPVVLFDGTRISQVFQNLIDNAVKYMDKPQGRIKIGCVEEDGQFKFSVSDNGPGIDERYFEKIFQIFQTLTRRDEKEATGIGLALVKKIIEIHGGKIWVESKIGHGSTFFFTLPKEEMETKNDRFSANIIS